MRSSVSRDALEDGLEDGLDLLWGSFCCARNLMFVVFRTANVFPAGNPFLGTSYLELVEGFGALKGLSVDAVMSWDITPGYVVRLGDNICFVLCSSLFAAQALRSRLRRFHA